MQPLKKVFEIAAPENREIVQPVLNIRLGHKHISCAVTAFSSGNCHALAYWTDDELNPDSVRELLNQDTIFTYPFYQVNICYEYGDNMLVPATGFRHEDASLLKLPVPSLFVTITELIAAWQIYNVYAIPGDLHALFAGKFPAAKCWHQTTVGLKNANAALPGGYIQADIKHHDFSVLITQSGKLLLAGSFDYSNPEDVIFYLLKICQQFSLSQNEVQVDLSGLFDKQSVLYKDLYQYFVNINIRESSWNIDRNDYPAHFFTTLNDLAKCVS